MRLQKYLRESATVTMGINVRNEKNNKFADLIVDGKKYYETRNSNSLKPYIGKRVAIVRTGEGKAKAIGEVTVGKPLQITSKEEFDKLYSKHLVPDTSKFQFKGEKWLYPMENPKRYSKEYEVKTKGKGVGRIARQVEINELAMKRDTKIEYTKTTPDAFYASIYTGVDQGTYKESFDIYAASDWYSKFHLAQKLRISEERIVNELKGKAVYGIYIWNIDFVDSAGNIAITPKGKGIAIQLFAAIETFMKEFGKRYDPQGIEFSGYAREKSRIKLYHHLSKKIAKAGYKFFPIGDYYTMVKEEYFKK